MSEDDLMRMPHKLGDHAKLPARRRPSKEEIEAQKKVVAGFSNLVYGEGELRLVRELRGGHTVSIDFNGEPLLEMVARLKLMLAEEETELSDILALRGT